MLSVGSKVKYMGAAHVIRSMDQATAIVRPFGRQDGDVYTDLARLTPWTDRSHKAAPGECPYCDRERATKNDFHPSHDASWRCESGHHNHCSCDTCF